jgi:uncharacterized membrane protein
MHSRIGLGLVAMSLMVAGVICSEDSRATAEEPKKAAPETISFKNDVQPILTASCVNCHGNGKRKRAGIDLSSYTTAVKALTPGNADKSKLHKSLIGKGAKLMPPRNPLPDEEIQTIKAWITAGAKNN